MCVFEKLNWAYMYTRREGWDSINRFNPAIFAVQMSCRWSFICSM